MSNIAQPTPLLSVQTRPRWVSALSLCLVIAALASLLFALTALLGIAANQSLIETGAAIGVPVLLAAFFSATGIGLWRMQAWGVGLYAAIGILGFANNIIRRAPSILGGNILEILLDVGAPLLMLAAWLFISRELWRAVKTRRQSQG